MEPRASISDKITYVGLPGSATTLAGAGYTQGTSSMTLEAYVGWPAGAVHYDVYTIEIRDGQEVAKEGTRTSWKAMHNGSGGLTEVSLRHGTMQSYPAGTSTRVVITHSAIRENEMVDAELEHVTPDGKLKATSLDHFFKPSELISNFVASGGVVAQVNGLIGSFSDIVYYIDGIRYTKTNILNKTYLPNKDTYVDIDKTSGTPPNYNDVANGASEPVLANGFIRVAKVITNATAITSVIDLPRRYAIDANNYPSFRATYTNPSASMSGFTPLFNIIQHNIGNAYNPATGVFTAPVKGLYTFSYHCHASNMTRMFCAITAAGQTDRSGEASMTTGTEWGQSGSMTILLNAGQTASCNFWFNVVTNIIDSHFDGYLIRKIP